MVSATVEEQGSFESGNGVASIKRTVGTLILMAACVEERNNTGLEHGHHTTVDSTQAPKECNQE